MDIGDQNAGASFKGKGAQHAGIYSIFVGTGADHIGIYSTFTQHFHGWWSTLPAPGAFLHILPIPLHPQRAHAGNRYDLAKDASFLLTIEVFLLTGCLFYLR